MLPPPLQEALNTWIAGEDPARLARAARALSEAYRERTGMGEALVLSDGEAAAYAASRMPATYEAVRAALAAALSASGLRPRTLLDCGAGTGAASWAAASLLELDAVACVEPCEAMRRAGRRLMQAGSAPLRRAAWRGDDLTACAPLPRAGLVVEGYMLGELRERERESAVLRLWEAAEEMLLLVEPGTPQGFLNLARAKRALVPLGAHVAAPCPNGAAGCPMAGEDWCHFTVRLPRTRLHKALKGGQAPYEDEKYAYLALTRTPPAAPCAYRVLRHPQTAVGRIGLTLCAGEEKVARTVTKKDPLWKRARKLAAGDALDRSELFQQSGAAQGGQKGVEQHGRGDHGEERVEQAAR